MSIKVEKEYGRDERYLENVEIEKTIDWIKKDQFSHGEWGRRGERDENVRTEEDSMVDPNVFLSVYAIQALRILGADITAEEEKMCNWMEKLRDKKGYWISKVARMAPYGQKERVNIRNLRHTAKGLDYLLQTGKFIDRRDADVLRSILKKQNKKDGGFSQFSGEKSELWATAYFVNLMITLKSKVELLKKSNNEEDEEIRNDLDRRIHRAILFILSQKTKKKIWGKNRESYEATTTGILVQIGTYLVRKYPGEYREIMRHLGKIETERKYTRIYLTLIGLHLFDKEEQKQVFQILKTDRAKLEDIEKIDLVEVLAYGCVQKFRNDLGVLRYYNTLNQGHELVVPDALIGMGGRNVQEEYWKWCLRKYKDVSFQNESREVNASDINITNKVELWEFCVNLFGKYKFFIEEGRGWEELWRDDKPALEKQVQNRFWAYVDAFQDGHAVMVDRERYSGDGRVDFEFSNGYAERILIEFKIASNRGLKSDAGISQIRQYMVSTKTDTAFLVVFGFDEKDTENIGKIEAAIEQIQTKEPERFIKLIYIDASKKCSASKLYMKEK